MQEYNPSELKRVQEINVKMAQFFVRFCEEHNLLCYFCGGGCIGAVRHGGFIPWDDDLDFFMPREDYEKLKTEWSDTDEYVLRFPSKTYNDHCMYTTLRDKRTTMIRPSQLDLDIVHGITVDIFPIDGCPSGKLARRSQLYHALIYQLFCTQIVPENHGKLIHFAGKAILGILRTKGLRYRIWKSAEKRMSKYRIADCRYITELCAGPKYMYNQYPKEAFEEAVYFDFDDTKMPIPVGYDVYLKTAFGDYMCLPPEEERKPSHESFIDTEHSYLMYKGKEYCVRK